MNILWQLRWKLTLSYTPMTVCAFLVVLLIMGGILLPRIFLANKFPRSHRDGWNPVRKYEPLMEPGVVAISIGSEADISAYERPSLTTR
jgi:hypothetical protein